MPSEGLRVAVEFAEQHLLIAKLRDESDFHAEHLSSNAQYPRYVVR
jgi:hypothetical protein